MKQKVSVLITDLDNTLYDWVHIWFSGFSAMLKQLVDQSEIDEETLKTEIQQVFQKHGTSEYSFVIEELPSLQAKHPGENLAERHRHTIKVREDAREASTCLYPTVYETLKTLKQRGCLIVGYTESMALYTIRRVKALGLDGLLDYLYSPAHHDLPDNLSLEQERHYASSLYKLQHTNHQHTPKGQYKPSVAVLLKILRDVSAGTEETIYVGDSLMKDVVMARDAGVTDVLAKYGEAQHRDEYQLLRRVTHWTKEDVEREKAILARKSIDATYVLNNSFSEVLNLFEFVPYNR